MVKSVELFSRRLATLVKEMGWTQEEFAARSGVSQSSANLYLRGKREPSLDVIDRIAAAVGVPTRVFFEDMEVFPLARFVPTPLEALGIVRTALENMVGTASPHPAVNLSHWPEPLLKPLALLTHKSDMEMVFKTAQQLVGLRRDSAAGKSAKAHRKIS